MAASPHCLPSPLQVVEEEIFVLNQTRGVPVHQTCAKLTNVRCDYCGQDIIGKMKASAESAKKFHAECWDKLEAELLPDADA